MKRAFLLLALMVIASVLLMSWPVSSGDEPEHKLWGVYWTVEPGFRSTLEMKNNRVVETITAHVSLYFANGEEYYLAPVRLEPRETSVLDLNRAVESLPANIRARAGTEGTVEVTFDAPNASAIMGSVTVRNPEQGIAWNFFLYPRLSQSVAPLRGVFWFPDQHSDGFVAIQNVSEQTVEMTPSIHTGGAVHSVTPVSLLPGQGYKLELRKELRLLGLSDTTAGGVELTYEGPADALRAHGVLFNRHGFSAEMDFLRYWEAGERRGFAYRTPRFPTGVADPRLGLPSATTFEPYLALHNFNGHPLEVNLQVGYKNGLTATQELSVPVSLATGETRVLSLRQHLNGRVPAAAHWGSLELSYEDRHPGLGMMMVSISEDGVHSLRSVLNWVQAVTREGWYWQADAETNTLLGILNTDAEAATVKVSLDYYADGIRRSYDLPDLSIPARGMHMLDVGELVASGTADRVGEVILEGVSFGGYRVQKIGPNFIGNITTEALVVDRRRGGLLSLYNTGCCHTNAQFFPWQFNSLVGDIEQFTITANNWCTGETVFLNGNYSSSSTSVVTVNGTGWMTLVGAGTATVFGSIWHMVGEFTFEPTCTNTLESGSCGVTARPWLSTISPTLGAIGATTAVTLSGQGFGTSPIVQAGSGITVNVTSANNTQIQANFVVSSSAPAGNHAVTVRVAGQTSNSVNFFVQVPTSLSIVPGTDSTTAEAACTTSAGLAGCGVTRTFTYQVKDQVGQAIQASMEFWDTINTSSPNNLNLQSYRTTCPGNTGPCGVFTFPSGTFSETLNVCAPACKSGGVCILAGSTGADQVWRVAGTALSSDVKHLSYQCDRILVNNQ